MKKLYKDNYFIYANGSIFNIRLNKFVGWKTHNGYQRVRIGCKTELAHILVYEHFGTLPEDYSRKKYHIHHINGNKLDNNINNLQCMLAADHNSFHSKGEKHPMYGKHHTEESKNKISEANKGKKHPMYGKHHTEESKQKLSEAKKGEKNPMYGRTGEKHPMYGRTGEKNPRYGKHHTEESKQKLSEAKKGEKNPNSKITDNQRFALIIKIIQKSKAGKSIKQAARELAEEYPLKPSGIETIWRRFKKRGKKIY